MVLTVAVCEEVSREDWERLRVLPDIGLHPAGAANSIEVVTECAKLDLVEGERSRDRPLKATPTYIDLHLRLGVHVVHEQLVISELSTDLLITVPST